jgi:hypothetical protein
MHASRDFSDGEICMFGTSLDFSNGEIQTGAFWVPQGPFGAPGLSLNVNGSAVAINCMV